MNKDKFKKILINTGLVLVSIIAFISIYYVVTNRILRRINNKYVPLISAYTIVTNSMEPNLNIYDLAVDIKVDNNTNIKKGDIITFVSSNTNSNGQTITHRVVDIIEENNITYYKTKGDNNSKEDDLLITKDNIIGKYLFKIPKLGKLGYKV